MGNGQGGNAFLRLTSHVSHKAYLSEIFSSIQGEGLLVGVRQIFVRFSGCSLTCDYCDTPESRVQSSEFNIVGAYGNTPLPNPVSPQKLTEVVHSFQTRPNLHHSISLTGGEPLEQSDFLREWLPEFNNNHELPPSPSLLMRGSEGALICKVPKPKIYLETNGVLVSDLAGIIKHIDIIGMDIKLPSVSGVKALWNLHRDFLRLASEREVFVKVVAGRGVDEEEICRASEIIASVNPCIPLIIQPRTPIDMDFAQILRLHEIAAERLSDVRVIPQVHKLMNMM